MPPKQRKPKKVKTGFAALLPLRPDDIAQSPSVALSNRWLDEHTAQLLFTTLATNTALESLSLPNSGLQDVSTGRLLEPALSSRALTLLDLSGNPWLGEATATALQRVLETQATLKDLRLSACVFGPDGCAAVMKGLCAAPVTDLNLDIDSIGLGRSPLGVELVAALLSSNKLRHLNLESNGLTEDHCLLIASSVAAATSLHKLYLSKSGLGDAGATALANSIADHPSLESLSISDCPLTGNEGLKALAGALTTNTSLDRLYLRGNAGDADAGTVLGASLQRNFGLSVLSMNVLQMAAAKALVDRDVHETLEQHSQRRTRRLALCRVLAAIGQRFRTNEVPPLDPVVCADASPRAMAVAKLLFRLRVSRSAESSVVAVIGRKVVTMI